MDILRRGAPARKKLDALELKIEETLAELAAVREAPRAKAEVLADIRRDLETDQVERMSVMRDISGYYSTLKEARFEARRALNQPLTLVDLSVLLGVEKLMANIAPQLRGGDGEGLPLEQRAEKLVQLQVRLREERAAAEREAVRLETEGHNVLRRLDLIDVEVLLDVWAKEAA